MTNFEYKVVPAPMRGLKARGVKGTPARFANALETVMNDHGAQGWEYQRTDTLPVEERQGLTGKTTSYQNMLVFRRVVEVEAPPLPPVAALIEDHSNDDPAPQEAHDTAPIADETHADATSDIPDDAPVSSAPEASAPIDSVPSTSPAPEVRPVVAQDRVSDAEDEPFTFPWNKRSAALVSANDGDTKET